MSGKLLENQSSIFNFNSSIRFQSHESICLVSLPATHFKRTNSPAMTSLIRSFLEAGDFLFGASTNPFTCRGIWVNCFNLSPRYSVVRSYWPSLTRLSGRSTMISRLFGGKKTLSLTWDEVGSFLLASLLESHLKFNWWNFLTCKMSKAKANKFLKYWSNLNSMGTCIA